LSELETQPFLTDSRECRWSQASVRNNQGENI